MSAMDGGSLREDRGSTQAWLMHALPNAVTVLALWAGMSALIYVMHGDFDRAIACVLAAGLLDACDGRIARLTGTTSRFGAELDSLSDVVCFGAVPAFILYGWGLHVFGASGWLACLILVAAAALRLARFNVAANSPIQRPVWTASFFTGVPAPAGAFLAMVPIYVANGGLLGEEAASALAVVTVPLVAALMVSRIPTFSGKAMGRMAGIRWFMPSLMAGLIAVVLALFEFWIAVSLAAAAYTFTIPFSHARHARLMSRLGASEPEDR